MYDKSDRLIPEYIRQAKKGEKLKVFGIEKSLDFTYIDDVVSGIISGIENFDKVKNNTYNLGSGTDTLILDVAKQINNAFNNNSKVDRQKSRTGEVIKYRADISKAREKLGFNPQTSIEEGIKKSIEWDSKNS